VAEKFWGAEGYWVAGVERQASPQSARLSGWGRLGGWGRAASEPPVSPGSGLVCTPLIASVRMMASKGKLSLVLEPFSNLDQRPIGCLLPPILEL
jgi:hypothetical protein